MTDTPRTDDVISRCDAEAGLGPQNDAKRNWLRQYFLRNLCLQLERELAAAKAELKRERLHSARLSDCLRDKDETRAAVIAIEAQKEAEQRAEAAEREQNALRNLIKSMGTGFDDETIDAAID